MQALKNIFRSIIQKENVLIEFDKLSYRIVWLEIVWNHLQIHF